MGRKLWNWGSLDEDDRVMVQIEADPSPAETALATIALINGEDIELTIAQCREVHRRLGDMLGYIGEPVPNTNPTETEV